MAANWTSTGKRSAQATELLTEVAPVAATDGVSLELVSSVTPVLHAPAGQTFTAGVLLAYLYTGTKWVRLPRADCPLDELIGLEEGALPAIPVTSPRGRFAFIASGITLSGAGTQVTLELLCTTAPNGGRPE